MPRSKPAILFRNKSPYGWWIASYIERFEFADEDRKRANRRCLAWENTILVRADDRDAAYDRAVAHATKGGRRVPVTTTSGRRGAWIFEGLTSLLPVYDELEDGAELLWVEHAGRAVKNIKARIKRKRELEAFDDSKEG